TESVLLRYHVDPGLIRSVPFAVIIVAVVLGGAALPSRGDATVLRLPRVTSGRVRPLRVVLWVGVAFLIPLLLSSTWSQTVINSSLFALLALAVVVGPGSAGQISGASAALAGIGSLAAARTVSDWHFPFAASIAAGVVAAIVVGIVFGGPAVRVRGVNLAIVTLGLSLAVEQVVLGRPSFTGGTDGLAVRAPSLFGFSLDPSAHPDRSAMLCMALVAAAGLIVLNIRRGVSGRRFLAVRANERGAASVGISVAGAKLGAFALSAALAGLAGALTTFRFRIADFSDYGVFKSILALTFTIVGG